MAHEITTETPSQAQSNTIDSLLRELASSSDTQLRLLMAEDGFCPELFLFDEDLNVRCELACQVIDSTISLRIATLSFDRKSLRKGTV